MRNVYQRIQDPKRGDCFKCTICSILGLEYDDVPNFIELPGEEWWEGAKKLFKEHGYELGGEFLFNPNVLYIEDPTYCCSNKIIYSEDARQISQLKEDDGIDGIFMASVYSPKYTNVHDNPRDHLHSVLCDINFNIVFDPNPEYSDVIEYPYAHLIGYNGIRGIDTIKRIE